LGSALPNILLQPSITAVLACRYLSNANYTFGSAAVNFDGCIVDGFVDSRAVFSLGPAIRVIQDIYSSFGPFVKLTNNLANAIAHSIPKSWNLLDISKLIRESIIYPPHIG
jgi:hypothetical protein